MHNEFIQKIFKNFASMYLQITTSNCLLILDLDASDIFELHRKSFLPKPKLHIDFFAIDPKRRKQVFSKFIEHLAEKKLCSTTNKCSHCSDSFDPNKLCCCDST